MRRPGDDHRTTRARPGKLGALAAAGAVLLASGCASVIPDAMFPEEPYGPFAAFPEVAPAAGEHAPAFELTSLAGERVTLADLHGDQPLVLLIGSYSCPMFRYRERWVRDLAERYRGRAVVAVVYSAEMHPVGAPSPATGAEWDVSVNHFAGVCLDQPGDLPGRVDRARFACREMGLDGDDRAAVLLVDDMDDAVWDAYGRGGAPCFVIDPAGRVRYRAPWIEPDQLCRTLDEVLSEGSPPDDADVATAPATR